ncbi:MAG TPA: hypothetical protein VKB38_11985 [Terracidiphilus sp.]|nr:hypothetical protein [Terracidiphilus sp.]
MNFTANQAYELCDWLDTQPKYPPTSAPTGWKPAFVPTFFDRDYAVVLESTSDSDQLAVVIMGTHDVSQMLQDTHISDPGPFVNSSGGTIIAGAEVANGASAAFTKVLKLRQLPHLETLKEYLEHKAKSKGLNVLVAGHSLGGTTASLFAPWLASVMLKQTPLTVPLPPAIQAVTFAAFAAGNQAFATYLNGSTQYQPNINVNDIVPYVWATTGSYQVSSVYTSFASPGPPMPESLQKKLKKKVGTIPKGFNYIQTNEPSTFTGTILPAPSFSTCGLSREKLQEHQWFWEVSLQHNYAYCVQFLNSNCTLPSSDCPKS